MIEPGKDVIVENIKEPIKLKVKKLLPEATLPTKGTKEAAGWDLYAAEERCFDESYTEKWKEGEIVDSYVVPISTGIAVAIPKGHVGLVCSRSGSVYKQQFHVANQPGIIDSDYRGEIKVLITPYDNHHVQKGDRIAQLVIVPIPEVEFQEVEDLDATERGEGGFGSTGVR